MYRCRAASPVQGCQEPVFCWAEHVSLVPYIIRWPCPPVRTRIIRTIVGRKWTLVLAVDIDPWADCAI